MTPTQLTPEPGAALSPGPWTCTDDGTILDALGRPVCVLGAPFAEVTEQEITNGAAIMLLPGLLDLFARSLGVLQLMHTVRPTNWDDPEDPVLTHAYTALDRLLADIGGGGDTHD